MQWLLRFRVCIIICLAVMLITAAVVFSVLRAVLPYATGYKQEIQQEISAQIGLPVDIESIDAAIHWFSPRLRLIGVSVYDEKSKVPLFNFAEAFVELDVITSLLRREIIVDDVGLVSADISIEKLSEEEWLIQGIKITSDGSSELPERFTYMLQNADFLLHDSNIYYQDHTGEKLSLNLLDVNVDIQNTFNNHDIRFSMNLPEAYGKDFSLVARLNGDIGSINGDVYIEASRINVKQWNKKFKFEKLYDLSANIDVQLWVTLADNKLESLETQLKANDVSIKNTANKKRWQSEFLSGKFRYETEDSEWSIDIADFYYGVEGLPKWGVTSALSLRVEEDFYYLDADFLRLEALLPALELAVNDSTKDLYNTVSRYSLRGDIYNLNLTLPKDVTKESVTDSMVLNVSLSDFSVNDDAHNLKLSGFDGSIHYKNKLADIDITSENLTVDYRTLFRQPLLADKLFGKAQLSLLSEEWQFNSDRIHLENAHITTYSRLNINSVKDDVFVDIQTDFYDADGEYSALYLPVGIMSEPLVDWLDMAIVDGKVSSGQFVLYGLANDFPYRDGNGMFQVLFDAENVTLKFLEEWPELRDLSATVKFINEGLYISDATGSTQNGRLYNGQASIENLDKPYLKVLTEARATNEEVQSYVWNSGLDDVLGDALRHFQFNGDSVLSLELDVPLDEEEVVVSVEGSLNLQNTELYYPALAYELRAVNGEVQFTENSIFADSLSAVVNGKPMSLNIFTQGKNENKIAIFHLDGLLSADYLLQRYDWIPEQWIQGESMWSIDIEVPYEEKDYLVLIKASSYLQGVELAVSDKMALSASDRVSFSTNIDVLDESGLRVETKIANVDAIGNLSDSLLNLNAVRDHELLWSFDVKSKYMQGKGAFTEGLGQETQIDLSLEHIDVHSMFYKKESGTSDPLIPSNIPPLNWKAKSVFWDDWTFTDVVVQTDWHRHGMLINKFYLNGPSMHFDARGTWLTTWRNTHETVLQGKIHSDHCGETLSGLGFQRSIDRCKYDATFDTKWTDVPYALSWGNVKGKTSFNMENGEILEVNPGTGGRLLGLLNIFKLTNRLAFDFDDVTREGFAFDYIKGDFEFVNGDGSLKNFDVSAPAADINMFGSIGLIKRDYGLLMRVKPHTDSITFAGGTLLGGVAIGAGLAIIQKVFDLGVIGHNVYSITGGWDNPQVEKIVERTSESEAEDDDF